jgi:hypothetical protein
VDSTQITDLSNLLDCLFRIKQSCPRCAWTEPIVAYLEGEIETLINAILNP